MNRPFHPNCGKLVKCDECAAHVDIADGTYIHQTMRIICTGTFMVIHVKPLPNQPDFYVLEHAGQVVDLEWGIEYVPKLDQWVDGWFCVAVRSLP